MTADQIQIGDRFNLLGSSNKLNLTHIEVTRMTDKAILFETVSSEGSYLHDFNISIWLPVSVLNKYASIEPEVLGGVNITLPFWFSPTVKKSVIK